MDAVVAVNASHIAPADYKQVDTDTRGVRAILNTDDGSRHDYGIMRWKNWSLNTMAHLKTQFERIPGTPMAYQPSGEVLRGDEFVQINFWDELKRFYIDDRKCHR